MQVRALDADTGEFGSLRYELVRGSGELFGVNRSSGEVVLKQPLVASSKNLTLTVAAYDGGTPPLSTQAHLYIRSVLRIILEKYHNISSTLKHIVKM